jgi:hypothetical protein
VPRDPPKWGALPVEEKKGKVDPRPPQHGAKWGRVGGSDGRRCHNTFYVLRDKLTRPRHALALVTFLDRTVLSLPGTGQVRDRSSLLLGHRPLPLDRLVPPNQWHSVLDGRRTPSLIRTKWRTRAPRPVCPYLNHSPVAPERRDGCQCRHRTYITYTPMLRTTRSGFFF